MPRKYSKQRKRKSVKRRTPRKSRKSGKRRTLRKSRKRRTSRKKSSRKQLGGRDKFYDDVDDVIELSGDDFKSLHQSHPITKGKPGMVMMYADWCPHCSNPQTRGMWSKMGKMVDNNSGWVGAMNCAEESNGNKTFADSIGIRGFPTVMLVTDKGVVSKR